MTRVRYILPLIMAAATLPAWSLARPKVVVQIVEQLQARELVKINVLKNCDYGAKEIAEDVASSTGSEVVQVLGNKITLYKVSAKDGVKHLLEV